MPESTANPPRQRALPVAGAIVFLVACLAQSWCMRLPFQADDYLILPRVGELLRFDAPSAPLGMPAYATENHYLFRPTAWFLWWALIKLSGGVASPPLFHLLALVLHGAAASLLLAVLRRIASMRAALFGALLFAVLPGGIQAVTWISAGGDQLAVVFVLLLGLCILRHRARGRWASALGAAAAGFLAFCSKDVALASFPLVGMLWFAGPSRPRPSPRPWRLLGCVALAVAAALGARAWYLGTWQPQYLSAVTFQLADLKQLPAILAHSIAYWNSAPVFADLAPWTARFFSWLGSDRPVVWLRLVALATAALPAAIGLFFEPRNLLRMLILAAGWVLVLVPPILVFFDNGEHSISRVYYPAMAAFAAWIACSADGLFLRGRPWLVAAVLTPLALYTADMLVHFARTELRAGAAVAGRLESLDTIAATAPRGARFIVIDSEDAVGGIPTLYFTVVSAARPPFRRDPLMVDWWPNVNTLERLPVWREARGPLVVLQVEGCRFARLCTDVAPLPERFPALVQDQRVAGTWRFERPVPARAIAGLQFGIRPEAREARALEFVLLSQTHRPLDGSRAPGYPLTVPLDPAHPVPSTGTVAMPLPSTLEWLVDSECLGVRVDSAKVDRVAMAPQLPSVELVEPEPEARFLVGTTPPLAIRTNAADPMWRVILEFELDQNRRPTIVFEAMAQSLISDPDGRRRFDPTKFVGARLARGDGARTFDEVQRMVAEQLARSGSNWVPLWLRVEGFDPATKATTAQSAWRTFRVVGERALRR